MGFKKNNCPGLSIISNLLQMFKLYQNIVVEDVILDEKELGTKLYSLEEASLFNADAAIALYSFLKKNCLEWDPKDIHSDFFENDDSGFMMIQYSGSVVWRGGNSTELVAQFSSCNITS
jgi:hypothetical protein